METLFARNISFLNKTEYYSVNTLYGQSNIFEIFPFEASKFISNDCFSTSWKTIKISQFYILIKWDILYILKKEKRKKSRKEEEKKHSTPTLDYSYQS